MFQRILEEHQRAALLFSAGKDSLACLLMLWPHLEKIDVVWVNPGAPHGETVEYMKGIASRVPNFIEVNGDQPGWIEKNGWPVDVVPARHTVAGEAGAGAASLRFMPYFACCGANMWAPIQNFIKDSGHTLVITGQRKEETMRNRLRDEAVQTLDGVDYFQPLNDWTEPQVMDFIASKGEPLPPFYKDGATSSVDCWNCTAYLDHNAGRLRHMRQSEPGLWAVIQPVLAENKRAILAGIAPLDLLV